jgi:serine/threonine-protein kinase RsbW
MNSIDGITGKELIINSVPDNIVLVEAFIDEFRTNNDVSEETYGNMLVAITEAVNNAICHGNKYNSDKMVAVNLFRKKNVITCTVKDEGCGFDYTNLPDPTSPENIENTGGRGVFLMKNLADLVIFSNEGSYVEIHFRI